MPQRLSREQRRVLGDVLRLRAAVGISPVSLHEIAVSFGRDAKRADHSAETVFAGIQSNPLFQIVPFTIEIANEVAALGDALRDPSDRAIVATACVHNLRLVTSDERIIDSGLVPVVS
jgi:PIN domain nuclease of toxin-antitoxin system